MRGDRWEQEHGVKPLVLRLCLLWPPRFSLFLSRATHHSCGLSTSLVILLYSSLSPEQHTRIEPTVDLFSFLIYLREFLVPRLVMRLSLLLPLQLTAAHVKGERAALARVLCMMEWCSTRVHMSFSLNMDVFAGVVLPAAPHFPPPPPTAPRVSLAASFIRFVLLYAGCCPHYIYI